MITLERISKALEQQGRLSTRYRDAFGFIVTGIVLKVENGVIYVDTLQNAVSIDRVISIKHL